VRQIDALRVLSCFSVITVHAVGGPFPVDSIGLGETNFLLHYSREVFFFVSALVLVRTYYPRLGPNGRLSDEQGFRRRRLRVIGVPYLWWTTLYLALTIFHARASEPLGQTVDDLPLRWLILVVTGNASYHMYFLLVTLQFGVLFPLVLRLLRRTRGRHGRVLAASAVLQLATLACYHWVLLPGDGWRGLFGDASLLAYQLWLVAGAIAGLHLERWHRWVVEHRPLVLGAVPVAAAVLLWSYWAQLSALGALGASSPLQPVMVLWSVAALGALYLLAVRIIERGPEWVRGAFSYGAQLSFGVYLAHPMVLDLVLAVLRRAGLMRPSVWVSLAALMLTVVVTVVICAALHRTRLSLPLMGRTRLASAGSVTAPVDRSVTVWRRWLPRLRARLVTVPSGVLAASVLGVLVIGGDQTPPSEISRPSWEQTVEASSPLQVTDDDCADVVTATASSAGTGSTVAPATADPSASGGTGATVTASTTPATTSCASGTLGQ
jgi:peptidoglycan/LPS O-acetylase OafA/YrhL